MNLRVNHENQMMQTGQGNVSGPSKTGEVSSPQGAYRLANAIRNMNVGDTFTGKVTDINGQALELLLSDKSTINARLFQKMNISLGQTMAFEISSNSGGKVQLTPLYANLAGDSQIEKALQAAQIPMDSRSAEMVRTMMDEGMPIDTNSLLEMARIVNSNPNAAASSIVQMTKLQIPVNEENAGQFEVYKSNSHQIAGEISHLADGYSEIAKSDPGFNSRLLDIVVDTGDERMSGLLKDALEGKLPEVTVNSDTVNNPEGKAAENAGLSDAADKEAAVLETKDGLVVIKEDIKPEDQGMIKNDPAPLKEGGEILYGKNAVTGDLSRLLDENGRNELAQKMEDIGVPKSLTDRVRNANLSTKDTLDLIKTAIDELGDSAENKEQWKESLKSLTGSNEYGRLLKNEIAGRLLLSPEEVADKEKVKEYYEKLVEDTAKLGRLLSDTGRGETTLAKGTESLRENVDFMNQMNQVFTYMQLPLKLNNQSAHGDLYVYTNKKKLASNDGNVSALLHLDMEHLGTMDVHVSMNPGGNVKTHFILQKEEMLDFIASHLPELDERLKKRGYSVKSDVALNREEKSVPEIMFKTNKSERMIQHLSFDAKA